MKPHLTLAAIPPESAYDHVANAATRRLTG